MKKTIILFLVFCSLILLWCWTSKLSQNEIFEKKEKCAKYSDEINNRMNEKCQSYKDDITKTEWMNCYLDEIYYNIETNSCEYSRYWNYSSFKNEWKEVEASQWWYYVEDFLSSKEIIMEVCDKSDQECINKVKEKIKERKWR